MHPPETFLAQYAAALASQDWQQVEPLLHADVSVTFSNGSVHRGRQAVEAAYRHNFSVIQNEEYKMSDVHWVFQNESTAVYQFSFQWKGLINGQEAAGGGCGTAVLLQSGGRWLLLAEHLGPGR